MTARMSCALAAILWVCLATSATAAAEDQHVTRIPFVAVPDAEPARPSPPPDAFVTTPQPQAIRRTAPDTRVRIRAHRGLGYPDMDAVNDYIDWINKNFSGSVDTLGRYDSYGLGLEYQVARNWYGGLAYQRFEADTSGTTWYMGMPNHFTMDLTVDGGELYARKVWPEVVGPLDLEGLLGVGYYGSKYREQENGYVALGRDQDFGVRAGVGLTGNLAQNVQVMLEGGYLWLKFDDYRRGGDPVRFVSPGNPQVEADFSGFWASLALAIRF